MQTLINRVTEWQTEGSYTEFTQEKKKTSCAQMSIVPFLASEF